MSNPLLEKLEQRNAGDAASASSPRSIQRNPLLEKLEARAKLSDEERARQDSVVRTEAFWADATPAGGAEELPEWTSMNPDKQRFYDRTRSMFEESPDSESAEEVRVSAKIPEFKVESPLRGQVFRAWQNVVSADSGRISGFGGVPSVEDQIRDFQQKNIIDPDSQQRVSQVAQSGLALPESTEVKNERTGERMAFEFHTPTTAQQERRADMIKEVFGKNDKGDDDITTLLGKYLPAPDANGNVVLDGVAYPAEEVSLYADEYIKDRDHDRRFRENAQYRNEWFLQHTGMSADTYRNKVADELDKKLNELEKDIPHVPVQSTVYRGGSVVYDKDAAAKRMVKDARKVVNTLRKNNFWSGAAEGTNWESLLTFGLTDIGAKVSLLEALNKAEKGDRLTSTEQFYLDAWQLQQEAEQNIDFLGGRRKGASIGRGSMHTLVFVGQTAATGGIAGAATKGISRAAGKAMVQNAVKKGLGGKIASGLELGALKLAGSVVGAAARTPFQPLTYDIYAEKRLGQFDMTKRRDDAGDLRTVVSKAPQSAWKDALEASLESWAESHSEDMGMWLNAGLNSIGKRLAISRFGQSIGLNSLKGLKRNAALDWIGREGKIAGFASETLGEAYGDALVNLFENDREGWRQMMTKDYWWELGGVTLLLTGSFGALNLPAGISQARRNASLEQLKKKALSGVENEALKSRLAEAGGIDNIAARSEMLSGIDWHNKGISKMDAAHAIDFINAQTELDILQGEQSETERLARILPSLKRISEMEYKGADGKSSSGEVVFATTREGAEYFVLSGDLERGTLKCLTPAGQETTIDASSVAAREKIGMSDLISDEYVRMFGTQEQQQYLDRIQTRVEEARAAGVDGATIDDIIRDAGLTVYAPGDEVMTLDGREVVVSRVLGGKYEVLDDAGNVAEYGFNDILQPDAATARAQEMRADETQQSSTKARLGSETMRPEVEQAVTEAARQTDAVKNLDDDAVWSVTTSDGRPASIIKGANIAYNPETGEVDYTQSDATVVVRYADGEKKLVSIRDILSVDDVSTATDVVELARQAAETAVAMSDAEAAQPTAVGKQSVVRLAGGEEGVIEAVNEDGSYRFATLDETGHVATRDIRPEEIASNEVSASDGLLGRPLTDAEAQQVVAQMQENAVPTPQIELTPENWDAEFGPDGIVSTPLGEVKMGENQYLKLLKNGREKYFGMIKPTLANPDIVLEETDLKEGAERDSKYLFVKTFSRTDGNRYIHFESVTVKKDNREVAISSHEIDSGPFMKKMHNDKVVHLNESFFSSEGRLTEPRSEGPDLVPTPNDPSDDKGTISAPENQTPGEDIPRLRNGQPNYNAMTAEQLAPSLLERFGADRTATLARNNIAAADKQIATIEKQITSATDPNKLDVLDRKLQEVGAQRQKYTEVLDLLGIPVDEEESQSERMQRLKQENTSWIVELFPDGLPNVESVILSDIASGKKIRWTDKTVNGSVVSRGLGNELGLADSPSEQRRRFGLLSNDAPTPEEYVEELPERLTAMGIRFDEGVLRDQVIDVYGSMNTRRDARQALERLATDMRAEETPVNYEEAQQMRAYEEQQRALHKAGNSATFVETSKETNDGTAEERVERDNDGPGYVLGNVGGRVAGDTTRGLEGTGDRSGIRVFEEGLVAQSYDDSEYSERDRQEAEGQRLIAVAKQTGKYIDSNELAQLGIKYPQRTGESVVYIDKSANKVFKVKNPYAKAAIKNGAPEDAIFEHLIHNRLFPETKYTFEGITEHLGDVRIVLSQDFIPAGRSVSNDRIASALAERGFVREDNYTFGNDLVSVTDVEGDNVLPGNDGKLYFIDPIIKLKRPAREVLDELDARDAEEFREPDDHGDEVPFSVVGTENSAPAEVSTARWDVIIDQLRRAVGAENVVTDPAAVRAKYDEMVGRDEEIRQRQVAEANARFNEQLAQLTPENADSAIFDLGTPSPEMLAVGMPNKTLRLYGNKLLKKAEKHGYDIYQVRDLPQALEHPIAIFKGRYNGSFAILTELHINDKPALVTIGVNKDLINDINPVTSIYGKSANNLAKWIDAKKLLYTDKERTLDVLGLSAPIADALNGQEFEQKSVTTTKIVTNFENPKIGPENLRRSIFSLDTFNKEKREIERQAKADGTYLKAPNGQPTNLTPEQWLNVRTRAFKEWFGDWENDPANASKVVDENGEPRVVFHGANRERAKSAGIVPVGGTFHVFNTENAPAWFSTERSYSEIYARRGNLYAGFADRLVYPGYHIYNTFLNIKNPIDVGHIGSANIHTEDLIRELSEQSGLSTTELQQVFDEYGEDPYRMYYIVSSKPFKEHIVKLGYDGIAARESIRNVQTYAVVAPEQVKDARKNNGKYDSQNPDIRYFRTPQGEVYGFTMDGTIYLDGSWMNAETPIHEYTELWSQIVARENPQLWDKGTELMKQTKIWNEVNADPNYKELPEDLRVSETLSRIVAADFAGESKSITDDVALLGKIRAWLRKFWSELKATFSKWSNGELEKLTPKEFAKLPLRDFVEGIDLSKYNRTNSEQKTLAGVPYRTYRSLEERDEIVRNFARDLSDVRFMRQPKTEIEDIINSEQIGIEETRKTKNEKLIEQLRQAIRDQRNDVRTVAKLVSNRIRKSFGRELIDVMGKREFDSLIRQIEQAVQRRDAEAPLRRIADIVLDLEIKRKADKVKKFLELRVQGETSRGVSVAKTVDDQTREFIETLRNNLTRPVEDVQQELYDRGASLDAKMGAALLENYQAAEEHLHEIADIGKEIDELKARNTQLRRERVEANKAGRTEEFENLKDRIQRNIEQINALEEERLRAKQLRSFQLSIVAGDLEEKISRGRTLHNDWLEQREKRKVELLRTAFADAGDGKRIPVLDRQPGVWEKGWQTTKDFFLAPAYSFNYLLKMISVNAPGGEGALYDHFMRSEHGFVASRGKYYEGYKDFKAQLDAKAKEIFGKGYTQVLADSNRQTEADMTISDGREQWQYAPTVGEALYIYMVDKMADGRTKLRKMGIGEQEIAILADMLPDGYVRFADWIQNEFLPQRRKVYNDTHLEVFGTQMAEIENYVPLKIQKSNVYQEVDGTKTDVADLPSAITGSIIRRKRNNATLDLHTNALDLMLEHGQQMEHWNAFTRIVQDTNALLSSTNFRRMLDNRNPGLHKKLKIAAQIAADSYRPEANTLNKAWVSLSKMAASSKIAFRVNTAIKQVLSYPAFYAYSIDPKFWRLLTKNLVPSTWGHNFKWCLDNVPSFNERWLGRMAGDEKLAQMTAPQIDRWITKIGQWGMFPNALVDAMTCANGAKAVYDYRRSDYLKKGFTEVEAERRARIDAALSINETQQSSEGMFVSRLQVDRDFWSVALSTFQNSNFAYLRKALEGIDELRRDAERQRRNRAEYYKSQDMSDIDAWDAAVRDVVRAKRIAVANILTFTFVMNVLWGIGNNVWKYLFAEEGDDDLGEELAQSAFLATVRNTSVGSIAESVANGYDLNPSVLLSDMVGFIGKVKRIVEQDDPKAWDQTAAYIALQMLTANGAGIDMNAFVGMYEGVAGMLRDGADVEDVMLLLNAPRSQAKLIAGAPNKGESLDDYQRRQGYIERRIWANADKKQLDKWARNYAAYRQAEALGWPTERDKAGVVHIPRLKELDDAYGAMLKSAGLTKSAKERSDAGALTDAQREKFKSGFAKQVFDIYQLQNRLAAAVVFDDTYAEEMKRLVGMKQTAIEEWNN